MRRTPALSLLVALSLAITGALFWRAHVSARRVEQQASCTSGDPVACTALCSRDEPGACATLGDLTRDASPDRARAAYELACAAQVEKSCRELGRLLETTRGGAVDLAAAAQDYRKACDGKDEESCGWLGLLTHTGLGVARDDAAAAPWLDRGCASGVGDACFAFGEMAEKGEGVEKNESRAGLAYSHGCAANEPRSCLWLARSVSQETRLATIYVRRACIKQHANECDDVVYGPSPLVDPYFGGGALALRTCRAGNMRACLQAGIDALGDVHAPLDYAAATDYLTRACDSDPKLGCVQLANLYENGLGTPTDSVRARSLATRACGDAATHIEHQWKCPVPLTLRTGHGTVNGRLSSSVVTRVFNMAASGFPACWKTRGLTIVNGKVGVKVVIDRAGRVALAMSTSLEGVDELTADCIMNVIRELRFPLPEGGIVTVEFPVMLGLDTL